MCPCIGYRSLAFIFIWALIPIYWVYLVRQPLIPLKVQAQGKKKDIEAGVTLSSSISVSLEVVVSHTKCVGWAPQRSEGCPRYHSHSCLLLTHVLWNTDCDDSKDGHRALWFSLSSQPPTQISHPFHKASTCSASVLMGEKKKLSLADVQSSDNNKTGHWWEKLSGRLHCERRHKYCSQTDSQPASNSSAELAHKEQLTPCAIQDFCIQTHLSWISQSTGRSGCTRTTQLLAATLPESGQPSLRFPGLSWKV